MVECYHTQKKHVGGMNRKARSGGDKPRHWAHDQLEERDATASINCHDIEIESQPGTLARVQSTEDSRDRLENDCEARVTLELVRTLRHDYMDQRYQVTAATAYSRLYTEETQIAQKALPGMSLSASVARGTETP